MEVLIELILNAGKSAVNLALYVLLPVMVVMLALMKALEARGVLAWVARLLAPVLERFGIPGLGVFALLQLLLVSFAAPVAALAVMDGDGTSKRHIAATLAAVLVMSQANVVFPMAAVGLNLGVVIATSLIGAVIASSLTYYLLTRHWSEGAEPVSAHRVPEVERERKPLVSVLGEGGQEGLQIVLKALPMLILAIFAVNVLRATGVIDALEWLLSPVLALVGISGAAVLPIATKFIAGGTAMMGVALELLQAGALTVVELNRIAGFIINPLDLVGVAVLVSAGKRVAAVAKPALIGAAAGMLARGVMHLVIF